MTKAGKSLMMAAAVSLSSTPTMAEAKSRARPYPYDVGTATMAENDTLVDLFNRWEKVWHEE